MSDIEKEKSCEKSSDISVDEIYSDLGEFGLWQWLGLALLWLPSMAAGLIVLTFSFAGLQPKTFHCQSESNSCLNGQDLLKDLGAFAVSANDNKTNYCMARPVAVQADGTCHFDMSRPFQKCHPDNEMGGRVEYGKFAMDSTIVTDFNLICDDAYKVGLVGSIFMVGMFTGAALSGKLCDIIGRKRTSIILCLTMAVAQGLGGVAPNYAAFVAFRFFTAVGAGAFLSAFTCSVEIVGAKYRSYAGGLINIPFALGEALAGVIAYFVRDWKTYQFVTAAVLLLIALASFIAPESPRWLLANRKTKQLRAIVGQIAKLNKRSLSPRSQERLGAMLARLEEEEENETKEKDVKQTKLDNDKKVSLFDVFRHSVMRRSIFIMFVNWIVVTLGYYGLSMISVSIGNDAFSSAILSALIEIPSYVFVTLFIDNFGRKPILLFTLFLTGISCIPAGYVVGDLQTVLSLAGKFGASAAFALVYLYTAEIFPTLVRATVVGLCSMFARVGGILAPQVALYLPVVTGSTQAPMILMGVCALCGSVVTLWLPETLGSLTIQSTQDVDNLDTITKPFFAVWSGKKLTNHLQQLTEKQQDLNRDNSTNA